MLKELVEQSKLRRVKAALEEHRIPAVIVKDQKELYDYLRTVIKKEMLVCRGGSVTLDELGLVDHFDEIPLINHNAAHLSTVEKEACRRKGLDADVYLMSSSAITMQGEIYNMDGTRNRLAALLYGPKQVYIIAGKNKIVEDLEEAKTRMKEISAVQNCKRLQTNTPCVKTGVCMDCKSSGRICCDEVIIHWQMRADRIHVILIDQDLGY